MPEVVKPQITKLQNSAWNTGLVNRNLRRSPSGASGSCGVFDCAMIASRLGIRKNRIGATTSAAHTAVKLAPNYSEPVVHVLDASRSVPVVSSLCNASQRDGYIVALKEEQEAMRKSHAERMAAKKYVSLDAARDNRLAIDWEAATIAKPAQAGVTVLEDVTVGDLRPYIDWTPLFRSWELHGVYPQILEDEKVGEGATKLFKDANALLDRALRARHAGDLVADLRAERGRKQQECYEA